MNISNVGHGTVHLLAGGGKIWADVAAKFVRIEKPILEVVDGPYNANIVKNLLNSGHLSALEFDNFIFGIEGFSRVTEVQLVRKRMASYLIKSGRAEMHGKRACSLVLPKEVESFSTYWGPGHQLTVREWLRMGEVLYDEMLKAGIPEEDARYIKPQGTEFKAIVAMNAHALIDWFKIRCCLNAQKEIRLLAYQMLNLCRGVAPDLFKDAGPSCKSLGYCPENRLQNPECKRPGWYLPKDEALEILNKAQKERAYVGDK